VEAFVEQTPYSYCSQSLCSCALVVTPSSGAYRIALPPKGLNMNTEFETSLVHAVRQKHIMRGLWWRGGINVLRDVS
jgi:hypothetical protein